MRIGHCKDFLTDVLSVSPLSKQMTSANDQNVNFEALYGG